MFTWIDMLLTGVLAGMAASFVTFILFGVMIANGTNERNSALYNEGFQNGYQKGYQDGQKVGEFNAQG